MEPANPGTRRDIIVSVGPCTRAEVEDAREMILAALAPHMDVFRTEARVLPKDSRILTAEDVETIMAPDPSTVPQWRTPDWEEFAKAQRTLMSLEKIPTWEEISEEFHQLVNELRANSKSELVPAREVEPLLNVAATLRASAARLEASSHAFELRMLALLERIKGNLRKLRS